MARFAFIGIVCAAVLGAQSVQAQGIQDIRPPAETPPASYTAGQYVDSRGCAYIRAGRGVTTWVPRVTRSRTHLCGLQPSVVRQSRPAQVEEAPIQVRRVPVQPRAVQPQPRVVTAPVPVQPAPRAQPVVTQSARSSACPSASASSQPYINTGPGVRCGPQQWTSNNRVTQTTTSSGQAQAVVVQQQRPATVISDKKPVKQHPPAWVGPNPNDRVVSARRQDPPAGYREVWTDDRLNTRRGLNEGNRRVVVKPATGAAAGSYVQAGSFQSQADATRAANALRRQGLPAKVGVGRTRSVVLIGPFSNQGSLQSALNRARSAGLSAKVVR